MIKIIFGFTVNTGSRDSGATPQNAASSARGHPFGTSDDEKERVMSYIKYVCIVIKIFVSVVLHRFCVFYAI